MGTEPYLQPVIGERLTHRIANKEDGAHLDIVVENFWDVIMYRCLTHSHRATITPLSPNAIVEMCSRRKEPMTKDSEKWSMDHSLPLFSQQLEAWVIR